MVRGGDGEGRAWDAGMCTVMEKCDDLGCAHTLRGYILCDTAIVVALSPLLIRW